MFEFVVYRFTRLWLICVFFAMPFVTSCGGGGGGGTESPAPPPPSQLLETPPQSPMTPPLDETELRAQYANHPEFTRQWGLGFVNADAVYARLHAREGAGVLPGNGVRVALIDTGIDQAHWGFDTSRITENLLSGANDEDGSRSSHGTLVASVIAALRAGQIPGDAFRREASIHGLAWGATINMYAIPTGSGANPYSPVSPTALTAVDQSFSGLFNTVLADRPDIINMSLSTDGLIELYSEEEIRENLARTLTELAQAGRTDDKTLIVVAAANSHGGGCTAAEHYCINEKINATSPEILAGLPAHINELRSHYVAAVAVDDTGTIASFSNRCGIAAKWCIAAPGVDIPVLYYGPIRRRDPMTFADLLVPGGRGYTEASGTSLAAPTVAGGLALLKQWFRGTLSNPALLSRLYTTARVTPDTVQVGEQCPAHLDTDGDRTTCELSSELGRGIMDLDMATAPVGQLSFNGAPAWASRFYTGPAMGDALTPLVNHEVALFDELDAPFWLGLGNFVAPGAAYDLDHRMARVIAGHTTFPQFASTPNHLGLSAELIDTRDSHLGLAAGGMRMRYTGQAMSVSAFATPVGTLPVYGLGLNWQLNALRLDAGWLRERRTLLRSTAGGAFGSMAADTVFTGIGSAFEVGTWRVTADAELGTVMPAVNSQLNLSPLWTSAFSFTASKGHLRLSFSQPLRVEQGQASLHLPTGRRREGSVIYSTAHVSLVPSGRQFDLSVSWDQPLFLGALNLEATLTHHPRHTRAVPDFMLLAGYHLRF